MTVLKVLKQFLLLVVPITVGLFGLVYFVYSGEISNQQNSMREHERQNVRLARTAIDNELSFALADLKYLSKSIAGQSVGEIQENFLIFAKEKMLYDQIRFLSLDGMELVRVNYAQNTSSLVPQNALQSKKDRYYFLETLNLKDDAFFISPLDLNIERGIVERPFKPVIRLGKLVTGSDGEARGVLILNYLALDMLKTFRSNVAHLNGSLWLLNQDGFWLSHELREREWGFMFGEDQRFQTTFSAQWADMIKQDEGQVDTSDGLFTYATVSPVHSQLTPNQPPYFWKIIAHVPAPLLALQKIDQVHLTLLVAGPIYLVMLMACAWLAASRVKSLESKAALKVSEERNRAIVDLSLDAIVTTDKKGMVLSWNPSAEKMFGYSAREALGQRINELIIPNTIGAKHTTALAEFQRTGKQGILGQRIEREACSKEGQLFPISIVVAAQGEGENMLLSAFIQDLTQSKKIEERDRLVKAVFDETQEAISICDQNNRIIMINRAFTKITGYELNDVLGKDPRTLASGEHNKDFFQAMWDRISHDGQWLGEVWNTHAKGHIYPVRISIATVKDDTGEVQNYISVFNDITREKAEQDAIRRQAHHDSLTGLPNRLLFLDRLEQAIRMGERDHQQFALMFIDLDDFKIVNDTLGHHAGDAMLEEVAKRLRNIARQSDTVARLGGDEFTLIWRKLKHERDMNTIMDKAIDTLCGSWTFEGTELDISASIGYALYPRDGKTAQEMLNSSDQLMYQVKQKKKKRA